MLSSQFKSVYYPGKELSIDEGTCPFKGRVQFCTYNPNKPHKWGMKVYQVGDTSTGYCCSFNVVTGQSSTTRGLVLGLLHDYLERGQ